MFPGDDPLQEIFLDLKFFVGILTIFLQICTQFYNIHGLNIQSLSFIWVDYVRKYWSRHKVPYCAMAQKDRQTHKQADGHQPVGFTKILNGRHAKTVTARKLILLQNITIF